MKKESKLWIVLIVLFLVSACAKKRHVHITGRVLNPITQEGIKGVELWLLKPGSITEYYGAYDKVTTVYTDANGNFEIDLKSANAEKLRLGDINGDYYKIGWKYKGTTYPNDLPVEHGEDENADYYAVPYGKYKSIVHNVNCQGPTDTAYFKWKYTLAPNKYNYWSPPRVGCYSGSDNTPHKLPCGKYIWITKVKRTGNTTFQYKYDTVFIPDTGVVTFTINY